MCERCTLLESFSSCFQLALLRLAPQRKLQNLQEANESLTLQLNSKRYQLKSVQTQISKAEETQHRMREQVGILSASLVQAQKDVKKAETLATSLAHKREVIALLIVCK